jgi:hypothetical protein
VALEIPWEPTLRAALHVETGPISPEVDCMKVQPLLGWRPVSTIHYNNIITGANFLICKGLIGPVYTTVEKASGRSRMLGQDMVM